MARTNPAAPARELVDLSGTTRASRSTQVHSPTAGQRRARDRICQINAVLDRVGNNPDYWAGLYEEQEAGHGAQSTRRLMAASGYPGGDLELDDRLETDGERVCFRLLQTAMSRLTVGHYKWVRATRRTSSTRCRSSSASSARSACRRGHARPRPDQRRPRPPSTRPPRQRYSASGGGRTSTRSPCQLRDGERMRRALSLPQLRRRDRKREAEPRP